MASSPMRTISLRTIAAHKVRLFLTLLSVVLGTAFIAGSSMFTATLQHSFESVVSTAFDDVDVVVQQDINPAGIDYAEAEKLRKDPRVESVSVSARNVTVVIGNDKGERLEGGGGAPSEALAYVPGAATNKQFELTEGNYPEAGQVAINDRTAELNGIKPGDTLTVINPKGRSEVPVSGIYHYPTSTGSSSSLLYPESDFVREFTDGTHVSSVSIELKDHDEAATKAFRDDVAKMFPDEKIADAKVLAEQLTDTIKKALSFVNYFLWAFAGIALIVGTFIISNTFAMIVAQRNREFALLRAIGISRKQITRSVVFEAVVVGLFGSLLGIVAGMGLVKALTALMEAKSLGLPDAGLSLSPQGIIAPLVAGTLVTVVSAWAPARAAGRVHPVRAMRSQEQTSVRSLLPRSIIGGVLVVGGAVASVMAAYSDGEVKLRAITIGVAALAIIIGTWLILPLLSIPFVAGIGRVLGLPFRRVGHLASTNARRNPRRTAATAFALTLGLMMVSSIGMLGATMRSSLSDMLDTGLKAELLLTTPQGSNLSIPGDAVDKVREVDGVRDVVTGALISGSAEDMSLASPFGPPTLPIIDGDVTQAIEVDKVSGQFTSDLVVNTTVKDALTAAGISDVKLAHLNNSLTRSVGGVFKDNPILGQGYISPAVAREIAPGEDLPVNSVFLTLDEGANASAVRAEVEAVTKPYMTINVQDKEEYKGESVKTVSTMLSVLYGLLGLSVIIAVLGIINTLALSVIERRQEIGMLRAVGMLRSQIRRMIYIESANIAVFGALVGAAIGLGVGWCFVTTLSGQGLDSIVVPWANMAWMIVASGVIGVLAAVIPGTRAARTKPLEAITD